MEYQRFSDAIMALKYFGEGETSRAEVIDGRLVPTIMKLDDEFLAAKGKPLAAIPAEVWSDLLWNKFGPGGRITSALGRGLEKICLVNCTALGEVKDSMQGIMSAMSDLASLLQSSAGVGADFSSIRYRGAPVKGVGGLASGPVSFMKIGDAICKTVESAGNRRGAMIAVLDVRHPDIEEFIACKENRGEMTQYNISVGIPDGFMEAVEADADWDLRFPVEDGPVVRTVKARHLWDLIMRHTYEHSEPGVLFIGKAQYKNNTAWQERILVCNP